MEDIIAIAGRLLGAIVVAVILALAPKVKAWLTAKIGATNMAYLETLITSLVKAADQLYKTEDPDGTIRNKYVKDEIQKLGYAITDEINALIEANVFDLPHSDK